MQGQNINDNIIVEFLNHLREKYLRIFTKIVAEQIRKYISRGRITPDFDPNTNLTTDLKNLDQLMRKTLRSERARKENPDLMYNDEWIKLTENLLALQNSRDIKGIIHNIDRVNNCIHNTSEVMLTKLDNGYDLLSAFKHVHNAKYPQMFRFMVYDEIKDVV